MSNSHLPPDSSSSGSSAPRGGEVVFDPAAAHQAKPRLRPVRGFPAQATAPDGTEHQMLGLADARQVSDKVVMTIPAAALILPLMDGSRELDEIVSQVGRGLTRPILEQLVAQLDDAGLLEGPSFDRMAARLRADFDSATVLPPASTAAFADALLAQAEGVDKDSLSEEAQAEVVRGEFRKVFDLWMAEALKDVPDPAFDALPKGIVAPHLDYGRGWINYASVYGRLRVAERPDRVIVLGTNHFGEATGVCGCDKGYQTPLGVCEVDAGVMDGLRQRLGDAFYANRYDHEREHSVELQIPWIQHIFGKDDAGRYPTVFGALVHDPVVKNGESYDGAGISLQAFVDALKATIAALPGRTLVVASADLSHVGPAFGDQQPLGGEDEATAAARNKVFQHDREMIELLAQNKPDQLVASMAWQQNPTRWCSLGNLVAALLVTEPKDVRVLNYSAAMDQQGMTMVSSLAAAMV